MAKLRLNWGQLFHTIQLGSTDLEQALQKHSKDELGLVKNTTAKIHVDAQTKPRFCKARPVPYTLRTHQLTREDEETDETGTYMYSVYRTCSKVTNPISVTVVANQAELLMEVDTGASASAISESAYQQLWPGNPPSLRQAAYIRYLGLLVSRSSCSL